MSSIVTEPEAVLAPEQLASVLDLYEQGLYLQAYELGRSIAPLKAWGNTEARILAGRMAGNLGGPKLGDWHFVRAYRRAPDHPETCWYFANYLANRRGPLFAWEFMRRKGDFPHAAPELRAHWFALHGTVLGRLRDFDAAADWLVRAEKTDASHPWIALERAALYALEDRHDDAEQAARRALAMRPWYRPAVQWVAHFLVEKERDGEAVELLTDAAARLESCAIYTQLAALQIELKRYEDCGRSLDEFERLAPLLEKELAEWLAARRSDVAYYLGDFEQAREQAKKVSGRFYETIAGRLEDPPPDARRVELNVGFVRQHHQTCAPATLAAICKFWHMPGEHLEMAAAISYAGTPHHSERRWAEEHGWVVREFTVTWDSAVALLDRGIPFTLTTTEPTTSHLQACIGYDARRGTLVIRDPSLRNQAELLADGLFERYRSTGPRGKALVPSEWAHRLTGLGLPDAALYDHLYALERGLEVHDRDRAERAWRAMRDVAPDHRLSWDARRTLARYDADQTQILACVDELLKRFPEDTALQLARAACLRELSRRDDHLAVLKTLADRSPTDPVCWQRYAAELAFDAREHPRALALLRRSVRATPAAAGNYYQLANIRWAQRRFDDALALYRFAFCLEDKDEFLARAYFRAARSRARTAEALDVLKRRFERFGARSWLPARTLYGAYAELERLPEAFAVLEDAMRLRPDDGDLVLFVAEMAGQHGDFDRAEGLLARAEGKSQPTVWLRTAANLASARGDLARARTLWAEVVRVEPLAEDAHRALADRLADTQGREAAKAHLAATCERFPHNYALTRLYLDWLRDDGVAAGEPVVRRLIEIHPADAWARRELAWYLLEQGRLDEAARETEIARQLEPTAVATFNVLGQLHARQGHVEEAKEAYRQAIRTAVDYEYALHELVALCETHVERREALRFVHQELVRQVIYGEALLAFRDVALLALEPDELLKILREALDARPDLWHAWAAVVRQLLDADRPDEAHALARQAVERFPLLPALWLDLARACRLRKDDAGEIDALDRALQINPTWTVALRQLADAYERRGQPDIARTTLERAVARAPLAAINHYELAELRWRHGEREAALDCVRHAFDLDPGLDRAWDRLCDWSRRLEKPEVALDAAKALTGRRAGEARSWLRLAQAWMRLPRRPDADQEKLRVDETLRAFDAAIALNPRNPDYHDQKAAALAQARRFDEARAACRPPAWGAKPPLMLRGRSAWVAAQEGKFDEAIAQMRAVLQEDPKYYWAWTQVADWCQATSRFADYLQAANEMCKLAPHTAVPLAYRGEAKLRTGDPAGGTADLREALALTPDYALPGILLFDEALAAGDLPEARRLLEHLTTHVGGDVVTARAVQYHCRGNEPEAAVAALRRLCASGDPMTWPLDAAAQAFAQAGWTDRLFGVFRDAVEEPHWHPHVAVLWSERYDPRHDPDPGPILAALDDACRRSPGDLRPVDLKAELLGRVRRFDEAMAFCRGHLRPEFAVPLRGRMAWLDRQRGNDAEAIARMRAVCEEDPGYWWGWSQLAEWFEALKRPTDHLAAAERLVALQPNNGLGYSHRGAARRNLGDLNGAEQDYRKAIELAPGDEFSALQLFGMQYERRDYARAEHTLRLVEKTIHPKEIAMRRVYLAFATETPNKALDVLPVLCDPAGGRGHLLEEAAGEFIHRGWEDRLEQKLGGLLHLADQTVGRVWVQTLQSLPDRNPVRNIDRRLEKGKVSKEALVGILDGLAASRDAAPIVRLVERHGRALAGDTWTWGNLGRILNTVKEEERAVRWMSDWADRHDVEAWMLLNLAISLRGLNRDDEAETVSRFAVKQAKPDYTVPYHRAWLALGAALAGDADAAGQFLQGDLAGLDDYHLLVATFARMVWRTLVVPDRGQSFREARDALATTVPMLGPIAHDDGLTRGYYRTLDGVADNCGGLLAQAWRAWRRWFPLLPPNKADAAAGPAPA
jgi:tetratricopeptide (TPR) repeat protein